MATLCPKCKKGTLKKGEKMVYCTEYKPKKSGNDFVNEGTCDFHIAFKNSAWGKAITPQEIKQIVEGTKVTNQKGDTLELDLDSKFFTKITYAPKQEDEDL